MIVHTAARAAYTPTSRRANRTLAGTFKSVTRLYAVRRAYLARRAERHNAALAADGTYTAAQYLRRVVGATAEFVAANAISFGKAAAKAHRSLFGTNPAQEGLTVIGNHPRFTPIATYGPGESAALAQAARNHAAIVPAAPKPETPAATVEPATVTAPAAPRTSRLQVVLVAYNTFEIHNLARIGHSVDRVAYYDWAEAKNAADRLEHAAALNGAS
jgi:hypothetical protein